jgi:tRNA(Arg) A34 adenosine deaminase TadA
MNIQHLQRAIELALRAEAKGNLPVGAVIVLDNTVIAEGESMIFEPIFHPGRHAEVQALGQVAPEMWKRRREMTCYTTLEPCVMCLGTLLLHGVGRVVFGANDPLGGAGSMLAHLPPYYKGGIGTPEWTGPILPELCDALYARAKDRFAERDRDNV